MTSRKVQAVVPAEQEGKTIAAIVRDAMGAIAWSKARDLVRTGRVRLDDAAVTDDAQRVRAGQSVVIEPTAPKRTEGVLAQDAIVHLDGDVVVVRKPAGVITVPFEEGDRDTLVDRVRVLLARIEKARARASSAPQRRDPMVGVVQRLDKDTTGLLVFARNMNAKRALEQQLRVHSVERRYHAIVHGTAHAGTIETDLVQNRGDGLRGSWGRFRHQPGPPPEDAKHAITHVRVVEKLHGATLVECRLETGRQHQIRIHLAEQGNPLVGEPVYIRDFEGKRIEAARPMLHARVLGFTHPRTGEKVRFEDEWPDDFAACVERLRAR